MKVSSKSIKRINVFIGNGLKMKIYNSQKKKQNMKENIGNGVGNAEAEKAKSRDRSSHTQQVPASSPARQDLALDSECVLNRYVEIKNTGDLPS